MLRDAGFLLSEKGVMMYKRIKSVWLILCLIFLMEIGASAQSDVTLGKIVVTPVRYPREMKKIAGSVSIITREDINNSNAQTVPDILRTQTGLVVRDYYGNGTKVTVDLRGFGETAGSNTLILIDGRRINEIDLSGVDWTQIPLERIERIEIVRGANSVLYGDNATGGVINIITKSGEGRQRINFKCIGGSYDMNRNEISLNGSSENLSYFINAINYHNHGYRRNSDYRDSNFYAKFIYRLSNRIALNLSSGYHDSDYGLPGSLKENQLANYSRRDSLNMEDNAGEEDYYILSEPKITFGGDNELNLPVSFRKRYMNTYWGTGGWGVNRSQIDTLSFCPKVVLNTNIFKKPDTLILGLDFYKIDSTMRDYSASGTKTGDSDVDKKSTGGYLHNEFSISDKFIFNAGYRYEKASYNFDYLDFTGTYTNIHDAVSFNEEAFKAGLVYNHKDNSNVFINIAESFRLPVTEEFMRYNFLVWPFGRYINKSLVPQKSLSYEMGMNQKINSRLDTTLTIFLMKIKNEIFFNPDTFNNENYDKTEHRGLETGWSWNIHDNLRLFGNYTFTEAFFDGGAYAGNQIPAVPRHKVILGLDWQPYQHWQINSIINYVGERYFISDQAHNYPQMSDYITVDVKLSYKSDNIKFFFGINNIFNDMYSEYGVISTTSAQRAYYPSPGRNFICGFSFTR